MDSHGEVVANYAINYGWLFAFLGAIFLIFFSYGFLHFGLFVNMNCKMPDGFNCRQPQLDIKELSFSIRNQKLIPIVLTEVSLFEEKCSSSVKFENPVRLGHRESQKILFSCEEFPILTEANLTISYKSEYSGLSFTEDGYLHFQRKEETAFTRQLTKVKQKISDIDFRSIFFSSS